MSPTLCPKCGARVLPLDNGGTPILVDIPSQVVVSSKGGESSVVVAYVVHQCAKKGGER